MAPKSQNATTVYIAGFVYMILLANTVYAPYTSNRRCVNENKMLFFLHIRPCVSIFVNLFSPLDVADMSDNEEISLYIA